MSSRRASDKLPLLIAVVMFPPKYEAGLFPPKERPPGMSMSSPIDMLEQAH